MMGQTSTSYASEQYERGDAYKIDENVLDYRNRLTKAVVDGQDYNQELNQLISLPCPISMKYAELNVQQLLENNNKSIDALKRIPTSLNVLEKYGRHLLKPVSARAGMWRSVKYSNPIYTDRVAPLKGCVDIMLKFGYAVENDDGLFFPEGKDPDTHVIKQLITDIVMAKKEIELYLDGKHPHSSQIEACLPQSTENTVKLLILGKRKHEHNGATDGNVENKQELQVKKCWICLERPAVLYCQTCDSKLMCKSCDTTWHGHPRRQNTPHVKIPIGADDVPKITTGINHQGAYGISSKQYIMDNVPSIAKPLVKGTNEFGNEAQTTNFEDRYSREHATINNPPASFRLNPSYNDMASNVRYPPIKSFNSLATPLKNQSIKNQTLPGRSQYSSNAFERRSIPDLQTMRLNCQEEIHKLDQVLNGILSEDDDFMNNEQFMTLNREKSKLIKERQMLESVMNDKTAKPEGKIPYSPAVFYPPATTENEPNSFVQVSENTSTLSKTVLETGKISQSSLGNTFKYSTGKEPTNDGIKTREVEKERFSMAVNPVLPTSLSGPGLHKWKCDHCTYINKAEVKVCEICFKTSDSPELVIQSDDKKSDVIQTYEKKCSQVGKKLDELQDEVYKEKKRAQMEYENSRQSLVKDDIPEPSDIKSEKQIPETTPPPNTKEELILPKQDEPWTFIKMTKENKQRQEKQLFDIEGEELFCVVKAADKLGYDIEEVKVAIEQSPGNILEWLKESWHSTIGKVATLATEIGSKLEQNNVGKISELEAKAALILLQGNVTSAVNNCVTSRQKLYEEINGDNLHDREEVLKAMLEFGGDKEKIEDHLLYLQLQPFHERIWENFTALSNDYNIEGCRSMSTCVIEESRFQDNVKNKSIDLERRIRMIMIEAKLKSWGRAETVIKIIDENNGTFEFCNMEDIIEAVRNCGDYKSSIAYLHQECEVCFGTFPINKITNFNICRCKLCLECTKQHFAHCVNEKNVRKWTCPVCSLPDMSEPNLAQEYISFLKLLVSNLCDQTVQDKFDKKTTEWHIQQQPNFRWCAHCEFGFLFEGDAARQYMTCENCKKKTCFNCKKKWEEAHKGISCEDFEQWKIDNDPQNQASALAKHLEENGIDCPSCKMRYSLAKGGCMHFTCLQCSYEFCSGCNQTFYHDNCPQKCKKGIHCHHPRDCFFYLRDESVKKLQELLKINKKKYNTDIIDSPKTCPVLEQKERGTKLTDEECGKEVKKGWAGLCIDHYKEYLVGLINKHSLDPLDIMTTGDIEILCKRLNLKGCKRDKEDDHSYVERLKKRIWKSEPLQRRIRHSQN